MEVEGSIWPHLDYGPKSYYVYTAFAIKETMEKFLQAFSSHSSRSYIFTFKDVHTLITIRPVQQGLAEFWSVSVLPCSTEVYCLIDLFWRRRSMAVTVRIQCPCRMDSSIPHVCVDGEICLWLNEKKKKTACGQHNMYFHLCSQIGKTPTLHFT